MQPHITVTGVPGDLPTMKPNGDALKLPQLIAPKFDTLRRPSCLPNDTEFNPRPKVRKTSSHDLSINDTFTTTSFNPSSNSGLSGDIMDSEPPPCLESVTSWVFGDVQYITDFLDRWPFFSFAIPLKLINATLRTMGAPLLLNSPISGSLILVALILDAPLTTCWGLAGLALSIIMALVLKQPQHIVTSGQVTQHGLLLGLLMGRALLHNTEHSLITTGITLALTAPLRYVLCSLGDTFRYVKHVVRSVYVCVYICECAKSICILNTCISVLYIWICKVWSKLRNYLSRSRMKYEA